MLCLNYLDTAQVHYWILSKNFFGFENSPIRRTLRDRCFKEFSDQSLAIDKLNCNTTEILRGGGLWWPFSAMGRRDKPERPIPVRGEALRLRMAIFGLVDRPGDRGDLPIVKRILQTPLHEYIAARRLCKEYVKHGAMRFMFRTPQSVYPNRRKCGGLWLPRLQSGLSVDRLRSIQASQRGHTLATCCSVQRTG
jgi:hypothetical protein